MTSQPIVYSLPSMDQVTCRKNFEYRNDAGEKLLADLYLPGGITPGKLPPVVVLIHGAVPPEVPVKPKDWGSFTSWGQLIAASGMAAVAFNHRVRWAGTGFYEAKLG